MMSLEIVVYVVVVGVALAHVIGTGFVYSSQFEAGGRWEGYLPGLERGWLFGRRIDLSDIQWRNFRAAIPSIVAVMSTFVLSSSTVHFVGAKFTIASALPRIRAAFVCIFAFVLLLYLHSWSSFYVFGMIISNWMLTWAVAGTRFGMPCMWGFNVASLLFARLTDGRLLQTLLGSNMISSLLDGDQGPIRWHICFNLAILRMISFSMDLHWKRCQEKQRDGAYAPSRGPLTSPRQRQAYAMPSERDYSLVCAMAHAVYPPLYLAGPIITYNDFMWQLNHQWNQTPTNNGDKGKSTTVGCEERSPILRQEIWRCGWRLAADIICIEILTHCIYFNAIAVHRIGLEYKDAGLRYGAQEVGLTGLWVLAFMWLKFAVIWRGFRMVALLDGIDPPENMKRCFANNYDIEGFWKGWHASYNRWIVRYIYIPMGGSARKLLIVWPVFLFVAVWHDLEWRLISWAWLICLAFVPEMAVKGMAASPVFDKWRTTGAFRALTAAMAACNIAVLMAANMVGFVVGVDGMTQLFKEMLRDPAYLMTALACFFCAAQIMFAYRERERRDPSRKDAAG